MANEEHLAVLRRAMREGPEVWNKWREEYPDIRPDLSGADLEGADLGSKDINDLVVRFNLTACDMRKTKFYTANLSEALLNDSDLREAHLILAKLQSAELRRANMIRAYLLGANLSEADLQGANLKYAAFGQTIIANADLSNVRGLEYIEHIAPSIVGLDTMVRSRGEIPRVFLKKAGVPEVVVREAKFLTSSRYCSCFVSYSNQDWGFIQRFHGDLADKGINYWFAPVALKLGEIIKGKLASEIEKCESFLLVLSEHSIESEWVRFEIKTASERKRKQSSFMIIPITLDDAIYRVQDSWLEDIKKSNIGDFRAWSDSERYRAAFEKVLQALRKRPDE